MNYQLRWRNRCSAQCAYSSISFYPLMLFFVCVLRTPKTLRFSVKKTKISSWESLELGEMLLDGAAFAVTANDPRWLSCILSKCGVTTKNEMNICVLGILWLHSFISSSEQVRSWSTYCVTSSAVVSLFAWSPSSFCCRVTSGQSRWAGRVRF